MDVTKLTRMRAEKAVARTADPEVLRLFEKHGNKHVRKKAARKLDLPEERRQGFVSA